MHAGKDRLKEASGMLSGPAGELDNIPGIGDAAAKKLTDGSGQLGGVATEIDSLAGNRCPQDQPQWLAEQEGSAACRTCPGSWPPSATRGRVSAPSCPSPAAR
jgi:hypothetical protein